MPSVFPLSVVIRPGSQSDVDKLVRAADAAVRDTDRVEYGSHRKGIELRCVWIDDAFEVIDRLNTALESEVKVVSRMVLMLTEPELMEPVMRVEVLVSPVLKPVTMALFSELRGQVVTESERPDAVALVAEAPLQELLDLPTRLRALTDSDATITSVTFSHHARV